MNYTFISGATGGIGKAFVYECAKTKDNLFLTGRSQRKLNDLKAEILKEYNVNIEVFACELTSEENREKMLDYIKSLNIKFSRIINVAGVDIQKAFTDYTMDKVKFQIAVNCQATVCLTHALLFLRAENAEIITISSMSGVTPMPYFALYSATKAMLTNFFISLHYELKKENVKVTVVLPGGVPTRPDIVEDIKNQGLWGKLSAKPASFVAIGALKAVRKNKLKYIPGFFNKFLNFIMKFVPMRLQLRFIANRWKKQTKDAF